MQRNGEPSPNRATPEGIAGIADTVSLIFDLTRQAHTSAMFVLGGAVAAGNIRMTQLQVFGFAAVHAFTPHTEAGGFHFLAHQVDHLRFRQAVEAFDGFKGGTVFPGHFDDA